MEEVGKLNEMLEAVLLERVEKEIREKKLVMGEGKKGETICECGIF